MILLVQPKTELFNSAQKVRLDRSPFRLNVDAVVESRAAIVVAAHFVVVLFYITISGDKVKAVKIRLVQRQ